MSTVVQAIFVAGLIFTPVSVSMAEEAPVTPEADSTTAEISSAEISTTEIDDRAEPQDAPTDSPTDVSAAPIVDLTPSYYQQTRLPLQGRAMYYNQGIMETVLKNRLRFGSVDICVECVGYVAMLRVGDLNRRVWIQLLDNTVHGPFHVIDAADVRHVPMLLEKAWAIDVDYETARRWGMRNPWTVTVLSEPPVHVRPETLVVKSPKFQIDIYRSDRLNYNHQSAEYFGDITELYIR